jgi:hypothetical protein
MKFLVLAFVLMINHSFAEVPEVTAYLMSCQELKESLQNYGRLVVIKKVLLFKKRVYVHQSVECSSDETKNYGVFKTSTERRCQVGEFCVADPVYTPSSDYSSGSTYDNGSSYDSGSSSSGSSYNPPSTSYEGPSYNPPSSETRGPRYCPGC